MCASLHQHLHKLFQVVQSRALIVQALQDVRTNDDARVTIENNAGITGAMAGLQQAPGSWDSCLQGYGVLTGDGAVCSVTFHASNPNYSA